MNAGQWRLEPLGADPACGLVRPFSVPRSREQPDSAVVPQRALVVPIVFPADSPMHPALQPAQNPGSSTGPKLCEYIGIRHEAERLRLESARFTGAS